MMYSAKILRSLFIVLVALMFVQCEKDDTSPQEINEIQMNGKDFAITSASMVGVSIVCTPVNASIPA